MARVSRDITIRSIVTTRVDPVEYASFTTNRAGLTYSHSQILYRFHDAKGRLLYVGVTHSHPDRWAAHRRCAVWWPQVASVTCRRYPSERLVLVAEVAAIKSEKPIYNIRSAVN